MYMKNLNFAFFPENTIYGTIKLALSVKDLRVLMLGSDLIVMRNFKILTSLIFTRSSN